MTSNNFVYAEILHSNVSLRKIMGCLFENFTTDRFSLLYSHFSIEMRNSCRFHVKAYFYDGIVESKMSKFWSLAGSFRWKKLKWYVNRLRRNFPSSRPRRDLYVSILSRARFYDYLLARSITFFFVFFLNFGRQNMDKPARQKVSALFCRNFHRRWFLVLSKRPNFTVFEFIRYYLNYLALKGFSRSIRKEPRFHKEPYLSSITRFLRFLDQTLAFWWRRQRFLFKALNSQKATHFLKHRRYIRVFSRVQKFVQEFFTYLYRAYLITYRQTHFFRLLLCITQVSFIPLRLVETKFSCFGLDNSTVTAIFVARYVMRKIEMKFTIRELFTPIAKEMRILKGKASIILGYKIQFVGRLTRRGKVRTTWKQGGGSPASTMNAQLEHSFYVGILRNGLACVRV